jgi:hypothetical protein
MKKKTKKSIEGILSLAVGKKASLDDLSKLLAEATCKKSRYIKLGVINKRRGFQAYEMAFDYGLLDDKTTEVFIRKKEKKPA